MRSDLVHIETFNTSWEAGIAKSLLETAGISVLIDGEITAQILPHIQSLHHGFRLLVGEADAERAVGVLRQWGESEKPEPAD